MEHMDAFALADGETEEALRAAEMVTAADTFDAIEIKDEFKDDHLPCFDFMATVGGTEIPLSIWWYDAKIAYQADAGKQSALKQMHSDFLSTMADVM